MRSFADSKKRTWELAIHVASIKRVRALTGTDLLAIADGKLLERLISDAVLLGDVLWALVKPQAELQGVTDEDFGGALAGDAVEEATKVFLEELVDFFPQSRRALLKRALTALRDFEEKTISVVGLELDKALAKVAATLGASSGSSLESPGSIPTL